MLTTITVAFYLLLPAYFANMAPVWLAKLGWLKFLDKPIDGGRKLGSDYLFGPNKTWRGLTAGVIVAVIVTAIQAALLSYPALAAISLLDYRHYFLLFGSLAGLGALLGDLAKSLIKRRLNIAAGRPWPVFDQLDFVTGFFCFTYWFTPWLVQPSGSVILTCFLITLLLHPLANIIGYLLGLKKVWW